MTSKKTSKRAFTLAATILMVAMALAGLGAMQAHNQPAMHASPKKTAMADATTATTYQAVGNKPNPVLNSNVTWSTFYSGWNPLEYNTGPTNTTLNASLSPNYANPISVNPTDIIAPGVLQGDRIGTNGEYWNNTSTWSLYTVNGGAVQSITDTNNGGQQAIQYSLNTSASSANQQGGTYSIPITSYPSANPAYDYLTLGMKLDGQTLTGVSANLQFVNSTGSFSKVYLSIYPGQIAYISVSLEQIMEAGAQFNTTQPGYSSYIHLYPSVILPETTTQATYHLDITQMSFSTNQYSLGTQAGANGSQKAFTQGTGQTTGLEEFHPDFTWSKIIDNGYSVSTSQTLQNTTESQSSISSGSYIEQVTYQGSLSLPTAPDLSYSNSNITMPISIDGKQFIVANLNGVSYTSTLSGMKNGTLAFGTVNPNSANTIVLEVDYTATQWNGISGVPGFWSNPLGYLEYYWYITLGALAGAIGLGTGMSAKAEGFRVAKK